MKLAEEEVEPLGSGAEGGPLLAVRGLNIRSGLGGKQRAIVTDVDLDVAEGEAIAIVGESGSGKSLTARAILGLLPEGVSATGSVTYRGSETLTLDERARRRLRGREMALLMQDPFTMLNPVVPCGSQIEHALRQGSRHRWSGRRERRAEALRRLGDVRIRAEAADRYPFQLSGGMRQRVGLAAAIANDPALLIADEPSTALDVTTQAEILALLAALRQARRMALILITHDLNVAFSSCDRVYVLYAGSLIEVAAAADVASQPRHPYTLGLLSAEPPADRRLRRLSSIPGAVPSAEDVRDVCAFSTRCRWVSEACTAKRPELESVSPGHWSRCIRLPEIAAEMQSAFVEAEQAVAPPQTDGSSPVVDIRGLRKTFAGGRRTPEAVALKGVTLSVAEGESVGLVGESGSGKTTLARCLLGLERPTSGEIVVDGAPMGPGAGRSPTDPLRRIVQIVFQDPYSSLNPMLTIGTTIRESLRAAGGKASRADVDAVLARVGLPPEYGDRKPVALSGGERQRVAIARAMAAGPRVIVCDEPVSALDVSVQAQILNLLSDLRAELNLSYLFITHDLAVARQVTDRICVLYQGTIVESGPTQRVLDHPTHEYTKRLIASIPAAERPVAGPTR